MKTIDLYWIQCSHKVEGEDRQRMKSRILKARYGDAVPPITTQEGGKPCFLAGSEGFSVSHSGEYFVMGFGEGKIGVDLELTVGETTRIDAIARRFFTPEEQEEIRSSPHPRQSFTRLWTQKEARVKMTGEGLGGLRKKIPCTLVDLSGELQRQSGNPGIFCSLACEGNYFTRMMRMEEYETIYEKR